jgi:signal recognition particle receptor subunit beta
MPATKLILRGVDGIVFVADSQEEEHGRQCRALENLMANIKGTRVRLQQDSVLQLNKRDLPNVLSVDALVNNCARKTSL